METAYSMQAEATDVFDINKEPESVRKEYGDTPFGRGCLAARRLKAWANHVVPPNDGGISLGQAAMAAFELSSRSG